MDNPAGGLSPTVESILAVSMAGLACALAASADKPGAGAAAVSAGLASEAGGAVVTGAASACRETCSRVVCSSTFSSGFSFFSGCGSGSVTARSGAGDGSVAPYITARWH